MILADSSVWIDFFRNLDTPQTRLLEQGIRTQSIAMGDLVLTEVLQGTRDRHDLSRTLARLSTLDVIRIVDEEVAIGAARNFQLLRSRGITPRKTIDTLIATRCIVDDIPLLYSDRDFNPFVRHLGLRSAMGASGVN